MISRARYVIIDAWSSDTLKLLGPIELAGNDARCRDTQRAKRQLQGRLALQINRARANIRNASPWLPSLTRPNGGREGPFLLFSELIVNSGQAATIRVIEKKNLISSSPETFTLVSFFRFYSIRDTNWFRIFWLLQLERGERLQGTNKNKKRECYFIVYDIFKNKTYRKLLSWIISCWLIY